MHRENNTQNQSHLVPTPLVPELGSAAADTEAARAVCVCTHKVLPELLYFRFCAGWGQGTKGAVKTKLSRAVSCDLSLEEAGSSC